MQTLLFPPPQLLWVQDSKSSQMLTLLISLLKKDTQTKNYVCCWEKMRDPKKAACLIILRDVRLQHRFFFSCCCPVHTVKNITVLIQQPQEDNFIQSVTVWTTMPNRDRHVECSPKPLSLSWQEMCCSVSWVWQTARWAKLNRRALNRAAEDSLNTWQKHASLSESQVVIGRYAGISMVRCTTVVNTQPRKHRWPTAAESTSLWAWLFIWQQQAQTHSTFTLCPYKPSAAFLVMEKMNPIYVRYSTVDTSGCEIYLPYCRIQQRIH